MLETFTLLGCQIWAQRNNNATWCFLHGFRKRQSSERCNIERWTIAHCMYSPNTMSPLYFHAEKPFNTSEIEPANPFDGFSDIPSKDWLVTCTWVWRRSLGNVPGGSVRGERARSRLYWSQILQVNMRWRALAEIYPMHSFAPCSNLNFFVKNRQNLFAIELMNIH